MATGVHFNVTVVSGLAAAWTHVSNAGNIDLDRTVLNHPDLNGAPTVLSLATKNVTPIGMVAIASRDAIGTWYDGARWTVFTQRAGAMMGEDFMFNVHALPADGSSLHHEAVALSIERNWTRFSHPDADGNPNAHVQITPTYGIGIYNNRVIGAYYDSDTSRWAVFNEDRTDMPTGAAFVVRVR